MDGFVLFYQRAVQPVQLVQPVQRRGQALLLFLFPAQFVKENKHNCLRATLSDSRVYNWNTSATISLYCFSALLAGYLRLIYIMYDSLRWGGVVGQTKGNASLGEQCKWCRSPVSVAAPSWGQCWSKCQIFTEHQCWGNLVVDNRAQSVVRARPRPSSSSRWSCNWVGDLEVEKEIPISVPEEACGCWVYVFNRDSSTTSTSSSEPTSTIHRTSHHRHSFNLKKGASPLEIFQGDKNISCL